MQITIGYKTGKDSTIHYLIDPKPGYEALHDKDPTRYIFNCIVVLNKYQNYVYNAQHKL